MHSSLKSTLALGDFIFLSFLLAYISCGGVLWHLHMYLQCILISFTPPSFPSPLHRTISTISLSTVIHVYKVHWQYSLSFTLFALFAPSGTHPGTGLILPSYPSFFKMYVDCSKVVCLGISHRYILYFKQVNLLYYLPFFYHLVPLLFNSLQWNSLYSLPTQMQCISILFHLSHSVFLSQILKQGMGDLLTKCEPTSFTFNHRMYFLYRPTG
jgi:hypothetical protein